MIKKIDALDLLIKPIVKVNPLNEDCQEYYNGQNLKVDNKPDLKIIRLVSICLTDSKTIVTIEIQPLEYLVTIWNPNSDNAFFIEYNNGKQHLSLKDVPPPILTNTELKITKPTKVNLEFDRLPKDIKKFNLLDGKNQKDNNYWNFKGIQLLN